MARARLSEACTQCGSAYYALGLCKAHYKASPATVAARHASKTRSRDANRASTRASYRAWYKRNSEKKIQQAMEHTRNTPEARRGIMQRRNAQKRAAGGSYTKAEWDAVMEAYGRRCLRCADTEDITVDHVLPVSKGGCSNIWNLQPLCRRCNCSKGART